MPTLLSLVRARSATLHLAVHCQDCYGSSASATVAPARALFILSMKELQPGPQRILTCAAMTAYMR